MAKSDFERRAEQIRSQIEDLRESLDDVLSNYNRLMTTSAEFFGQARKHVRSAAKQAQENASEVSEELAHMGIPWWLPVAILAAVGMGVAVMSSMRGQTEETFQTAPASQNLAGQTPTFNAGEPM